MANQTPLAGAKPWYKSLTLWGLVFTTIFTVMTTQGYDVPDLPANPDTEQLKEVYTEIKATKDKGGKTEDYLLQAGKWLSIVLTIYGRLRSKTQLTGNEEAATDINLKVREVATTDATVNDVGLRMPTVVKQAGT